MTLHVPCRDIAHVTLHVHSHVKLHVSCREIARVTFHMSRSLCALFKYHHPPEAKARLLELQSRLPGEVRSARRTLLMGFALDPSCGSRFMSATESLTKNEKEVVQRRWIPWHQATQCTNRLSMYRSAPGNAVQETVRISPTEIVPQVLQWYGPDEADEMLHAGLFEKQPNPDNPTRFLYRVRSQMDSSETSRARTVQVHAKSKLEEAEYQSVKQRLAQSNPGALQAGAAVHTGTSALYAPMRHAAAPEGALLPLEMHVAGMRGLDAELSDEGSEDSEKAKKANNMKDKEGKKDKKHKKDKKDKTKKD